MSRYALSKRNGSAIILVVIFICHLALKRDAIFGNVLVQDDLIMFPHSVSGVYLYGGWHYYFSAYLTQSLVLQKVYHLFLLSIGAVLLWILLHRFYRSKIVLMTALLVAFLAPMTVDQGIFIAGSSPVVGFATAFTGFLLSYRALCGDHEYVRRVLLAILAGVFYLLAAMFTSLFYLIFLAPLFYPWWTNRYLVENRWKLAGLLVISVFTVPLFQLLRYSLFGQGIVSHYAGMPGWVDYSITNVINQWTKFLHTFTGQFGIPSLALLLVLFILIAGIFLNGLKREHAGARSNETPHYVAGFLFLSAAFVLLMAPISATVFMPYRYVIAPGVFLVPLVFLVFDYALSGLDRKYAFPSRTKRYIQLSLTGLLIVVSVLFVSFSYYTQHYTYQRRYGDVISTQLLLESFIMDEQSDWDANAQIMILVNDFPGEFTSGFNHWSTWYLRHVSKRHDVIGLIGPERWLEHHPFVEAYRDHGEEYWYQVERQGSPFMARKKMVGLEHERPTYIYRIGEDTVETIEWIRIHNAGQIDLFQATINGIEYEGQYTIATMLAANNEHGITIHNSINYNIAPVEIRPLEVVPTSGFLYFDGSRDIRRDVPHRDVKDYTFELLFRSDTVPAQDYRYGRTSPPMPLLFLPLMAMYQVSDGEVNIYIGEDPASPVKIITLYNDDWVNLALTVKDGREMIVYVNGYPYDRVEGDFALGDTITVGRGYYERFWQGWIHYLVVNEGLLYDGEYTPSLTPIETEGTLLLIAGAT